MTERHGRPRAGVAFQVGLGTYDERPDDWQPADLVDPVATASCGCPC